MKNKFLIVSIAFTLVALFSTDILSAQVTSESNSSWIKVDSYNGSITSNAFRFSINLSGTNINYPNWSLMVRANPPIINSEGKAIDPSKISIRINQIAGGPTLAEIGTNQTPVPLSFNDVYIFEKSGYPLRNGPNEYYNKYTFDFDILIAGGSYLEALKTWDQYRMSLTFSVLRVNDRLLTQASSDVGIQIYPEDMPPSEPTYGIEVNSNAKNGMLEFKSVSDYVNGVSQTYENGLSIISDTPYQVQVRSLTSNFEADNNTLPISTVSLEIKDTQNSGIGGSITLSESLQTVFSASNPINGKEVRHFDLRYFTKPNDERMIKAKPDSYKTTLMYTLVPQ